MTFENLPGNCHIIPTWLLKNNIICHKYNYLQIIFIEVFFRSYFDGHESKKEKETDFEEGKALEK